MRLDDRLVVQLESLRVAQFRNLNQVEMTPMRPCGVSWRQRSGKTNLIEAIGTLATLKSFEPTEWPIRFSGSGFCAMKERSGRKATGESDGQPEQRRSARPMESRPSSFDYFESIRAVVFAPEHVELVRGAPDQGGIFGQGRFNSQAAYLNHFRGQETTRTESRAVGGPAFSGPQMEVLEEQLALSGARVSTRRARFVEALANPSESHTAYGATRRQHSLSRSLGEGSESERAENYLQLMRQRREEEHQRGATWWVPSEMIWSSSSLKKMPATLRLRDGGALVIALKLSELSCLQERREATLSRRSLHGWMPKDVEIARYSGVQRSPGVHQHHQPLDLGIIFEKSNNFE